MTPLTRALWIVASIAVTALLVVAWQMAADYGGIPAVFLPGPNQAWAALVDGWRAGAIASVTLATVKRMIYGWALASLGGIVIGALIGSSRTARDYLGPTLELVRPVPVSAFMPVVMAFLGFGGNMVLVVVAIGAVWPVLLATVHGVSALEPRLVDVARMLKLGRAQILWKIALPNSQADILAGARLGLTVSLILTVVGEMLTSENGLGYYILAQGRAFHSANLFAGVILLGLIGLVSNLALQAAEFRLLHWSRR
ncbi:MAG TPA: ABC transporter permease [Stellaceae bacterium]|nr:ABC transporter permease [Stellaceae bacterium]